MNKDIVSYTLLILLYVFAGYNKIFTFNNTSKVLENKILNIIPNLKLSMEFYRLTILLVIILELLCPFILAYFLIYKNEKYKKYAELSIYSLIIFTIFATLLFHLPATGNNYYHVMSNISTIGGLLLLLNYINK